MKTANILKTLGTVAIAAALTLGTASASTITYNFANQTGDTGGGMGNSLTYTFGGVTITETAWWLNTTSPVSGTTFQKAEVDAYNGYGVGVCNSSEGSACGSPAHQITNNNGIDFILLTFSTPVSLAGLTNDLSLLHYQDTASGASNADISYWTPSGLLTTSTTYGSLSGGNNVNNGCSTAPCTVNDTITSGASITQLLISAQVGGGGNDSFKLAGLTLNTVPSGGGTSSTPEPSTMVLLGSALLAGVVFTRRRQNQTAHVESR